MKIYYFLSSGFNWESCRKKWYVDLAPKAADLSKCGITTVWLPPPTESVAPQGYMPSDLYNLNSSYGTQEELKYYIEEMHKHHLLVVVKDCGGRGFGGGDLGGGGSMKIIILVLCCILTSSSSPLSISDGIFTSEPSSIGGRNLLQAKKPCPVNFEFMNYTIITSRCKGPRYPANLCCDAFKDFACPYAENLNDLSNECSSIMFSYINLYGNYPPGLFANLCRDDKIGLICPALAPGAQKNGVSNDSNNSHNVRSSSMLMLTVAFLLILFLWI
ncbi:hypothetical protein QVD17_05988 [Tagetes erecta]|uniref:Alpha-amylase n=1 Tax=Tagetes erecta TaxID=13708 RepID=A0AAD8PAY8_TARER|nr:hypothetical protein QVD17_05988 [Tagetes erecta]